MEKKISEATITNFFERSSQATSKYFKEIWQRNATTNSFNKKYYKKAVNLPSSNKVPFICGAGKSLENHLEFIIEHREKLNLIAVDVAFPVLYKAGIYPDITINIDASEGIKAAFMFKQYGCFKGVLLAATVTHPAVLDAWGNDIYLYNLKSKDPTLQSIERHLFPAHGSIDSQYNVGEFSINFASKYLNSKIIGFTGIDFAYLGNQLYAEGVAHKLEMDEDFVVHLFSNKGELVPSTGAFLLFQASFLNNYLNAYGRNSIIYNLSEGIIPLIYQKDEFAAVLNGAPVQKIEKPFSVFGRL